MSNPQFIASEFRDTVEALAADGDTALARLPDNCCKADELACQFDDLRLPFLALFSAHLSASEKRLIEDLDGLLEAMSGPQHSELWTEDAVRQHPAWAKVRQKAVEVLRGINWAARGEQGASPNDGPAKPSGNSEVGGGPPSVT